MRLLLDRGACPECMLGYTPGRRCPGPTRGTARPGLVKPCGATSITHDFGIPAHEAINRYARDAAHAVLSSPLRGLMGAEQGSCACRRAHKEAQPSVETAL